ncbi:right-handed parallel beta-helix repeat-containing protein [bacterium]|nr:right-handed parallel beta-helix repeat-containing protein [bacterium]
MKKGITVLSLLLIILLVTGASYSQELLSGQLSGFLTEGEYFVEDTIFVVENDSLTIDPGVTIFFMDSALFYIDGYLYTSGEESDSVLFVMHPDANEGWQGIDFTRLASDSSRMDYSRISGSYSSGIDVIASSPLFYDCVFSDNMGDTGGAINLESSNAVFQDCIFMNNSAEHGGAIYGSDCGMIMRRCDVIGNSAENGGGVGLVFSNDEPMIDSCFFAGNVANGAGGAIYCGSSNFLMSRTVVSDNSASNGGGFYWGSSDVSVMNCTFSNNSAATSGGGLYSNNSAPIITNTIVEGSTSHGFHFIDTDFYTVNYNCFYGNELGPFGGDFPQELGQVDRVNDNGDSCDVEQNIYLDPMFINAEDLNFHLMQDSPCINAGDPFAGFDPDDTRTDIGAFYRDADDAVDEGGMNETLPSSLSISSVYPNPFNSSVQVKIQLAVSSHLEVRAYDLLGREIGLLFQGMLNSGTNLVNWHAEKTLASGTYIIKAKSSEGIESSIRVMYLQ